MAIPYVCKASVTPSKIKPMPIAETKNPMMRVAAAMPLGPIRFKTFLADARNRYVVNIVATMAAETATKDTNSNFM